MKKLIAAAALIIAGISLNAQSWQTIEEGKALQIQGMDVSYITSYIKEVKGQDVYQITATISNSGDKIIHLFSQARYSFIEEPGNAWAHFRFTNATGTGLSSREGHIYPNTYQMMFPFKCNSSDKNDTYESRVIGVGLEAGQSKTGEWRVRVNKGEKPELSVFLKTY